MMEKRGQFYLLAAFVIVSIIMGLSYVYNSANAPNERNAIYDLGNEAGYEVKQLLNSLLLAGKSDVEINIEMKKVIVYYSERYAEMDIAIAYGDSTKVYVINASDIKVETPSGNKVNVILREETRSLEFQTVKKIYTIVRAERDGEKIFIVG